ncbi:hypothetical protein GQ464_007535 [Rhodocaloribacter litoris]|uniref:DUF6615 family protein n=1 Tax=Rhodocaloribacter litoris TaxID=2558931 RepID=UPI0014227FAB|nr:DUF6615 family protein [Rhodocaloribacter litoris]QXD16779.1 hypothetical protein GQ464_007535 [Rhodocaloribacter litoris]
MNAVCNTFRYLAYKTWNLLSSARLVQYQPGEETITDINVLELKKRHHLQIVTQTFSKPEEGKTGADWEWWLTGSSRHWFGFRVQAKVINLNTNKFEHLHYKSPKSKLYQSDRLIVNALRSKVPLVPLYCLYSHWNGDLHSQLFCCLTFGIAPEFFGCSLMSAFDVRQLRLQGNVLDLSSVRPHFYPWHCLVCCSGYGVTDLPSRARSFWHEVIRRNEISMKASEDEELDSDELADLREIYNNLDLAEDPPMHVSQLLSGELAEPPDQDIGGVIIVRESQEAVA